mgnify:CR=1 FL=1
MKGSFKYETILLFLPLDDVFTSLGMESAHKYREDELADILKKLSSEESGYGSILRAKGIVPAVEGEWFHFDLVPGEYEIRRVYCIEEAPLQSPPPLPRSEEKVSADHLHVYNGKRRDISDVYQ